MVLICATLPLSVSVLVLLPLMLAKGTPPATKAFTARVPWVTVSVTVSTALPASLSATLMPVMNLAAFCVAVCAPGTVFTGARLGAVSATLSL